MNYYDSLSLSIMQGKHDFSADSLMVALTNRQPVKTDSFANLTPIASANGYAPVSITLDTLSQTNGTTTLALADADPTITATGNIAEFQYMVIYNSTSSELIAWADRGAPVNMIENDTFTVDLPAVLMTFGVS